MAKLVIRFPFKMATFTRFAALNLFRKKISSSILIRVSPISTSKKNNEVSSLSETAEKLETQTAVKKNWMSYGFDFDNEQDDRNAMHATFFFSVTCCLVFGSFIFAYVPDFQLRDWAQREAFLELRRREHLGLPPIDKNLIDPEKIVLPTDEELGDTEIII